MDQHVPKLTATSSWTEAAAVLADPETACLSTILRHFLQSDLSFQALAASTRSSKAPNGHAKSDFETRTAAISVTQSGNGTYDLQQIKEDALWLTRCTRTDEVTALRTAVLEWQQRPRRRVLGEDGQEEGYSSGRRTPGWGGRHMDGSSGEPDAETRTRRKRLMRTWYEEQEALLAVRALLAKAHLTHSGSDVTAMDGESVDPLDVWMKQLHQRLCKTADPREEFADPGVAALSQLIDTFRTSVRALEEPARELIEELNENWRVEAATYTGHQLLQLLRLVFVLVYAHPPTSPIFARWFELFGQVNFLFGLPPLHALDANTASQIQSLVSIILVTMLDMEVTLSALNPDEPSETFALDDACVETISRSLALAVENAAAPAAPALVLWSTVGNVLRANGDDTSLDGIDRRDSLPASLPLTKSTPGTRRFGHAWRAYVNDLAPGDASIEHFMRAAIQGLDFLGQCCELSTTIENILGQQLFDQSTYSVVQTGLLLCLQSVCEIATYDASLVEAIIAVLRGRSAWSSDYDGHPFPSIQGELVSRFIRSRALCKLFDEALGRYPYEMRPLLFLSQVLLSSDESSAAIVRRLRNMDSFTDTVPHDFAGYETTRERQFDNCFVLREDLPLFSEPRVKRLLLTNGSSQSRDLVSRNQASQMSIPCSSEGFALSKEHPLIISWNFSYSLLTFLGEWLAEAHQGHLRRPMGEAEVNSISCDSLKLLIKVIEVALLEGNVQDAETLLSEASQALPHHSDIVTTVAAIFEDALSCSIRDDDTDAVALIAACIQFFATVVRPLPGRVWPLLSQPGLVGSENGGGRLMTVILSSEHVENAPLLLASTLDLFGCLVDDIVHNALIRHQPKRPETSRFQDVIELDSGVSDKQMSKIITSFTLITLDALQAINGQTDAGIAAKAAKLLQRLLYCSFELGDGSSCPPIFSVLRPAGELVANFFLGSSAITNLTNLLTKLTRLASQEAGALDPQGLSDSQNLAASCSNLLTALLRLAQRQNATTRQMAQRISQAIPMLVRIYAGQHVLQQTVAALLTEVANVIGLAHLDSMSMFSSFERETAQDAAVVLSEANDLTGSTTLVQTQWRFFSACLCSKQTWFACYLLTGRIPSKASKTASKTEQGADIRRPVFDITLDILSSLASIDTAADVAMLQVVADALNHWPWSLHRVCSHPKFLRQMSELLDGLQWEPRSKASQDVHRLANLTAGASVICEIFAMCLHGMRMAGNTSFIKQWAPKIPLLDQPGFKDPCYNKHLHQRFEKNFQSRFPGLHVEDFKKQVHGLDGASHYDLRCAESILGPFESAAGVQAGAGFQHEFQLADDNMCLVAAQKQMIVRWQLLCLQLVKDADKDEKLPKKLAYVAHECLEANKEAEENDSIFTDLRSLRIELATSIMQRLLEMRYSAGGMQSLLGAAWTVTRAGRPDFDNAFAGAEAGYYRLCVRLLLLCLQIYGTVDMLEPQVDDANSASPSTPKIPRFNPATASQTTSVMLEIASEVVAKGFRSLASQVHEQPVEVQPGDFVLLTSILQALLQVRGAEPTGFFVQLALRLCNFNLGQYATALFSWSDRITGANDDPIYGDISVGFLAAMSALPPLAESLATEGVLSRLNTSNLMSYFQRRGGTGPFEEPLRIYKIWTRGILPLVLNVLIAVGAPFAAEAATFLNNFTPQLEIASNALDSKATPTKRDPTAGCITYNAVCEAHTLALISVILDNYRANDDADVPVLAWDRAAIKEDVEVWSQGTRAFLRERIVPTTEKETVLSRAKPVGGDKELCGCESRLEELVLRELKGAGVVLGKV